MMNYYAGEKIFLIEPINLKPEYGMIKVGENDCYPTMVKKIVFSHYTDMAVDLSVFENLEEILIYESDIYALASPTATKIHMDGKMPLLDTPNIRSMIVENTEITDIPETVVSLEIENIENKTLTANEKLRYLEVNKQQQPLEVLAPNLSLVRCYDSQPLICHSQRMESYGSVMSDEVSGDELFTNNPVLRGEFREVTVFNGNVASVNVRGMRFLKGIGDSKVRDVNVTTPFMSFEIEIDHEPDFEIAGYNAHNIFSTRDTPDECNICYENTTNTLNICGHVFCKSCIMEWFGTSITCPCCRVIFCGIKAIEPMGPPVVEVDFEELAEEVFDSSDEMTD